jgi:inosine-uridine nucleoside N-ribohydrolase
MANVTGVIAGVDDVLAMLLALSASPEELEVVMISVTYGNVQLHR